MAEGLKSIVIGSLCSVGEIVLVSVAGELGQKVFAQSPQQGEKLGSFVAKQIAQYIKQKTTK